MVTRGRAGAGMRAVRRVGLRRPWAGAVPCPLRKIAQRPAPSAADVGPWVALRLWPGARSGARDLRGGVGRNWRPAAHVHPAGPPNRAASSTRVRGHGPGEWGARLSDLEGEAVFAPRAHNDLHHRLLDAGGLVRLPLGRPRLVRVGGGGGGAWPGDMCWGFHLSACRKRGARGRGWMGRGVGVGGGVVM